MTATAGPSFELPPHLHLVWSANAEALRVLAPRLADELEAMGLPSGVRWLMARDGAATAQIKPTPESCHWLGGSSMPTVSAAALLRDFTCTGGNVLLAGLGTGHEAGHLCRVMRAHCAVFIPVEDLALLKVVLHVCDLSPWLRAGRVVFLIGQEIGTALKDFLRDHPGYESPNRIVTLPHLESGSMDALRVGLERCAQDVERDRAGRMRAVHQEWLSGGTNGARAIARVAVISSEARTETFEIAAKLGRGLRSMGMEVLLNLPTSPQQGHPLARLTALREFRPDWVVVSGFGLPRLLDQIPASIPVTNWIWPTQVYRRSDSGPGPANRRVFVADAGGFNDAKREGTSGVELLEVGAEESRIETPAIDRKSAAVVVVADLPSIEPEALGITQPTHVMLWRSLCSALADRIAKPGPPNVSEFVDQGLRRAGVQLKDEEIRGRLVTQLEDVALDRMLALDAAISLQRAGMMVEAAGANWPEEWAGRSISGSVRMLSPDDFSRLCFARAAVFPIWNSKGVSLILDVLAQGGRPILRWPRQPLSALHPQLCGLLEALPQIRSSTELVGWLNQPAKKLQSESQWSAARARVLKDHTITKRLEFLMRSMGCSLAGESPAATGR